MTVLSKTFKRGKSAIELTKYPMQIMNMTGYVLFWYLLGVRLTWGHFHKTRSILVPFLGRFQKIRLPPPSLLYGSTLLPPCDTLRGTHAQGMLGLRKNNADWDRR